MEVAGSSPLPQLSCIQHELACFLSWLHCHSKVPRANRAPGARRGIRASWWLLRADYDAVDGLMAPNQPSQNALPLITLLLAGSGWRRRGSAAGQPGRRGEGKNDVPRRAASCLGLVVGTNLCKECHAVRPARCAPAVRLLLGARASRAWCSAVVQAHAAKCVPSARGLVWRHWLAGRTSLPKPPSAHCRWSGADGPAVEARASSASPALDTSTGPSSETGLPSRGRCSTCMPAAQASRHIWYRGGGGARVGQRKAQQPRGERGVQLPAGGRAGSTRAQRPAPAACARPSGHWSCRPSLPIYCAVRV